MNLYLDAFLEQATVALQAEMKLGWPFTGFQIYVEGLYKLKLIDDYAYKKYKDHYSRQRGSPLIVKDEKPSCRCYIENCQNTATKTALYLPTNKEKQVCQHHYEQIVGHEKWSVT